MKDENKAFIINELSGLRPVLIKAIHDQKIEEYKEEFKKENKKEPKKDLVLLFSTILLKNKVAMREADEILDELAEKLYREYKKQNRNKRVLLGVVNTFIFAMLLSLGLNFCGLYLKSTGLDLLKGYDPLTFLNFGNAVLIVFGSIIYYILTFIKK